MSGLYLAIAVFLATHLFATVRPVRRFLVGLVGERPYIIVFSLVSVGLLAWLGWAYARAPYVEVWPYSETAKWVPLVLMPVASVLAVAGLTSRNPFSLGAGSVGFDANHPGIVRLTAHPVIWALVLWSVAHIPPNGDQASLVLFGLLTALGLLGPFSLDRKRKTALGPEEWRRLRSEVGRSGFGAAARQIGIPRILGGLALYAALLLLHGPVIGVVPFPAG